VADAAGKGVARGLLVEGAVAIATLSGGLRRGRSQADAAMVEGNGPAAPLVACWDGRFLAVGPADDVHRQIVAAGYPLEAFDRVDASGCLVTPGLVDAHTHLIFAGTREREWQLRARGAGYLEVLAAGGGILSTVAATRAASAAELFDGGRRRLAEMLACGTTTAEAKSGYGLDVETELAMLEVIGRLDREGPVQLVPTFLGAHAVPAEFRAGSGARREEGAPPASGAAAVPSPQKGAGAGQWTGPDPTEAYVTYVVEDQLPRVASQGIARFCDVFCENGVFSAGQSRRILRAAAERGLALRLHADELAPSGGAELAAELGAVSADHLAAPSDEGVAALARVAGDGRAVVATLLPATSWFLGRHHFAPARRFIDAGIPVALATDLNPGTSPTLSLPLVMSIACLEMGLTPAEALTAVTVNAAHAVGLGAELGSLEPGQQADLVVWDLASVDQLPYWLGARPARIVVKRGRVVLDRR
jgi:imidazolonepropionase